MLSYTDLKSGAIFIDGGQPWEVLDYSFSKMNRQKGVVQIRIKNLINGKVVNRSVHSNDNFEEAEIVRHPVKYLYNHRGEYWFANGGRFSLSEDIIGRAGGFLKPNVEISAIKFADKIINIQLPIKVDLKVAETPPGDKGDTASGGRKTAILETGIKVSVPLFVNEGDTIRVNTETGEYTERVEKG